MSYQPKSLPHKNRPHLVRFFRFGNRIMGCIFRKEIYAGKFSFGMFKTRIFMEDPAVEDSFLLATESTLSCSVDFWELSYATYAWSSLALLSSF